MKQNLLFTFLLSLFLVSCRCKEDRIKEVVNKWNELHNTHNVVGFRDLYAADVLFYGLQTSMETCYAKKERFLTSDFRQEIISPINISYYSSGTIKCDFTKRTKYNKEKVRVREYYCYLLLEKIGSNYLITGESDLQSDQRRNRQINLGTKLARPSGNRGIYIAIVLLLLGAAVFYFIRKQRNKEALAWEEFKEQYKAPVEIEKIVANPAASEIPYDVNLAIKIKAAVMEEMENYFTNKPLTPAEKGFLFETFIIEKFDKNYFRLIEWRSDKFHKGIYAASSKLPDLEYQFKTTKHKDRLSIECKWRADFNNNRKIEIAREDQLENYWRYSKEERIEVFIILGVGGKPEKPEELFIIPLREIPGPSLHRNKLNDFKRYHEKGNFFYNPETKTLE